MADLMAINIMYEKPAPSALLPDAIEPVCSAYGGLQKKEEIKTDLLSNLLP